MAEQGSSGRRSSNFHQVMGLGKEAEPLRQRQITVVEVALLKSSGDENHQVMKISARKPSSYGGAGKWLSSKFLE